MLQNRLVLLSLISLLACQPGQNDKREVQIDLMGAVDSVQIFAEGWISTPMNERDLAIAPDARELMFSLISPDNSIRVLMRSQLNQDGWTRPEILPFSGAHADIEPFYHPNGKQLFFASNRPTHETDESPDFNIWRSDRIENTWADPVPLSAPVNLEGNEYYPSVSLNGNLYFTAIEPGRQSSEDIFVCRYENGSYHDREVLDSAINSPIYEFNAYVSPDEQWLLFSSYGRADGMGGGDLYFSQKGENGQWQAAENLGSQINSAQLDYCPFIDWENTTLYFSSNRLAENLKIQNYVGMQALYGQNLNGLGNIYRVQLDATPIAKSK